MLAIYVTTVVLLLYALLFGSSSGMSLENGTFCRLILIWYHNLKMLVFPSLGRMKQAHAWRFVPFSSAAARFYIAVYSSFTLFCTFDSNFLLGVWFVQILELPRHPYFVGVQFHPEFKSRPGKPSALFLGSSLLINSVLAKFMMKTWSSVSKLTMYEPLYDSHINCN